MISKKNFVFSLLYLGAQIMGRGARQVSMARNIYNVITYLGRTKR